MSRMVAAVESINSPFNGPDYTGSTQRTNEAVAGRTFGSFHTGGCNVTLADGSVRFMRETTDIAIHRGLGTISDGLPVGRD